MKRIVLCFDGTWNAITDPDTVTNVVKFANALAFTSKDGINQVAYYNSGVGSGGPIDRFLGGAFGVGLKGNVKRGLVFLALNYEKGDEIYILGFSRGAYTARAVAAVVGVAGIPLDISQSEIHWDYYRRYSKLRVELRDARGSPNKQEPIEKQLKALTEDFKTVARSSGADVPITCIGVWDTVGAYGIPMGFGLSGLSRLFTYWTRGFRDTAIGTTVKLGLHALAIDEMRPPFTPTFWTLGRDKNPEAQEVEQVWFPGVHSNVGGGYTDSGLSDLALAWMIGRVREKTGLQFNEEYMVKHIWPCPASTLYRTDQLFNRSREILPVAPNSMLTRFVAAIRKFLQIRDRGIKSRINEKVHWSVLNRRDYTLTIVDGLELQRYAPPNLPHNTEKVTQPIELERKLMARDRPWDEHCPLKGLRPCECQAREHGSAEQLARS